MATLQVKGLDDDLYAALSARAKRENRSISQEVVTLLQSHLANPSDSPRKATEAFLELAGSWADERSADTIANEIKKHRRSGVRFNEKNDVFD